MCPSGRSNTKKTYKILNLVIASALNRIVFTIPGSLISTLLFHCGVGQSFRSPACTTSQSRSVSTLQYSEMERYGTLTSLGSLAIGSEHTTCLYGRFYGRFYDVKKTVEIHLNTSCFFMFVSSQHITSE